MALPTPLPGAQRFATVNENLKKIIDEGEVQPGPTIRKFRTVRREGSREVEREIEHYTWPLAAVRSTLVIHRPDLIVCSIQLTHLAFS